MASLSVDVAVAGDAARNTGEQRKMSVADTLAQATKALRTHRDWMKKRISVVAPLGGEGVETDGVEGHRRAWEGLRQADAEGLGSSASVHGHPPIGGGSRPGTLPFGPGAPPPFRLQQGFASGQEWVEYLRQKRKLAKVAPGRTLVSVAEEIEGSPKGRRKVEHSRAARGSGPDVSKPREPLTLLNGDVLKQGLASGDDRDGGGHQTAAKVKKRKISKASVVPLPLAKTGQTGSTGLVDSTLPTTTSPGVFVSPPPNISSPPNAVTKAWGNLTSLDAYTESLGGQTPSVRKEEGGQEIAMDSEGSCDNEGRDEAMETSQGGRLFEIVPRSGPREPGIHRDEPTVSVSLPEEIGLSSPPIRQPLQLTKVPEMTHNISDTSTQDENSYTFEDIDTLQSSSTARVVAVSPAPKEQRSSYALHSKSKLEMSESGQKLIDTASLDSINPEPGAEEDKGMRLQPADKANGDLTIHALGTSVPEAVLQAVLPARKQRRTGAAVLTAPPFAGHTSKPTSGDGGLWVRPSTGTQSIQQPTSSHVAPSSLKTKADTAPQSATPTDRALASSVKTILPADSLNGGVVRARREEETLRDLNLPALKGTNTGDTYIGM